MKLIIDNQTGLQIPLKLMQHAADAAQDIEGFAVPSYIQLSITGDDEIKAINLSQRGLDKPTDVLSFPSLNYPKGSTLRIAQQQLLQEWDIDQRACFLGDIIISMDHAQSQALEYDHSLERELCYLLVHGLFHLFGYDHMNEEDKTLMRIKEEQSLNAAGLSREDREDALLLKKARQAMDAAYVPYSHFRVGACLLCDDGRMFTGCNVENASYGLSNCAERTAIFKAVSEGALNFSAIAIASDSMAPWPCGACRQVISEFCGDIRVLVTWGDGMLAESTLSELLPHSFSPSNGVQEHLGKEQHG